MKNSKRCVFKQARACQLCANILPLAPNPIIQGQRNSLICIISQAPGTRAHFSNIPWNDPSGDRLRSWLGMDKKTFYNESVLAILPMSFCYPGKGKSGDLPPIKACAPKWHPELLSVINPTLQILIGKHAQDYYLGDKLSLTQRLQNWRSYLPHRLVLPHPSPRNNIWLKKNDWFERDALPEIRQHLQAHLVVL